MRNQKFNKILLIILIIGLFVRILFLLHPPAILFDAKDYDALGKSIAEGKGFNMEGIKNTPYLGIRPPGYPIFLGAIYYLFGYNHLAVYAFQIILDLIIAILIYSILNKIFPKKNYKYFGAFLWSVNPISSFYCASILSEILYIFLFMLGFYIFFIKIYLEKKYKQLIYLSAILGYAALVKSFLLYVYVIFFVATIIFILQDRRDRRKENLKKITIVSILIISISIFALLSSAFAIRNYYLFKEPVNYGVGSSLAFIGGNPNMFTSEDIIYLNSIIQNEYKNLTPTQAIQNSKLVDAFFKEKIMQNKTIFMQNTLMRATLFWFEPFGIRSVFTLSGDEKSFDKTYAPSMTFVTQYGWIGFFTGLSPLFTSFAILVLVMWLLLIFLSIYGIYLLFFTYNQKFLTILIIVLCILFTGVYALTVVVPRYFIQNLMLLIIPVSVSTSMIWTKIRQKFR